MKGNKRYDTQFGIPKEFRNKVSVYDDIFTEEERDNIERYIITQVPYYWMDDTSYRILDDITDEPSSQMQLDLEESNTDSLGYKFIPPSHYSDGRKYQGRQGFGAIFREDRCKEDEPDVCGSHSLLGPHTDFVDTIYNTIVDKINFPLFDYLITRAFFQMNLNLDDKHIPDSIHIDSPEPHISIIYYVSDSDGDTIIYKNPLDMDNDSHWTEPNKYGFQDPIVPTFDSVVEKQRVSPKKGRVLVFDGLLWHTSNQPNESNRRVILNSNLIAKL